MERVGLGSGLSKESPAAYDRLMNQAVRDRLGDQQLADSRAAAARMTLRLPAPRGAAVN